MTDDLVIKYSLKYNDRQLNIALIAGKMFANFFKPAVEAEFERLEAPIEEDEDDYP
jgi:hypothetical protein